MCQNPHLNMTSLKMLMCMRKRLLQKLHTQARAKESNKALSCRTALWKPGKTDSCLDEGEAVQVLHKQPRKTLQCDIARHFRYKMENELVNHASRRSRKRTNKQKYTQNTLIRNLEAAAIPVDGLMAGNVKSPTQPLKTCMETNAAAGPSGTAVESLEV